MEIQHLFGKNPFYMPGSTGTSQYLVILLTSLGRFGVRNLDSGEFRIRVEPVDTAAIPKLARFLPSPIWKQPGDNGQERFSTVATDQKWLGELAHTASQALLQGNPETLPETLVNPELPAEARWLEHVCMCTQICTCWMVPSQLQKPTPPVAPADEREALTVQVRKLKLPGHTFARRWGLQTLRSKVAAALGQ